MSDRVRIHKALADAGVASRRRSEQLVIEGRVTVNGVAAGVGQSVDPEHDVLAVDGRPVGGGQRRIYLVLAKPEGVTSTVSDRHAVSTVLDLVPAALRSGATRLYPVGRLDRDAAGLLLLTNDGDWAQRMIHPRHGVEREYAVGLVAPIDATQQATLEAGIQMEEGTARLAHLRRATIVEQRTVAALIGGDVSALSWYLVTLQQGFKRQVRRMFGSVGAPVSRLVRIRLGTLRATGMRAGDVRDLSATERRQLEALVEQRPERGLVVSIDGPGGSGKSTVGMRAAAQLGYGFCDTGVLYRGLTWLAVERGVDLDDAAALVALASKVELAPDPQQRYVSMLVEGADVTAQLHTAAVDREVSRVSQHAQVRDALLPVQRALAAAGRMIMAGRDIGTVILPDADVKLYLDVSVKERARRRAQERGVAHNPDVLRQIETDLRQRDGVDSSRAAGPLRIPDGATVVETEGNTLSQTVEQVVGIVRASERSVGG